MEKNTSEQNIERLCRCLLLLHTPEEVRSFLGDLCTASELQEMSRRLLAAKLLNNHHLYSDIAEQTGLSTATISRVNRCMKFGDGYFTALERLEKSERRK